MPSNTIETILEFKDQFTKKYSEAMKKAQKSTGKTLKSLNETKFSILNLKSAFVGFAGAAGLGLVGKAFFSVGQEAEGLTLQFETLLGSTEAATARMKELSQFAASTPFQLGEISKASKVLQTLGGTSLATGDGLRLVGDAAAISGERIQDLAVHVGRAYSGLQANRPIGESAARLQELGLVSGATRNEIERLQQSARGKEAWEVLQKALSANSGAMEKLSNTAGGMISTIKDQLQEGIRQMLNSGIWDLFKTALSNVRDIMDKLIKGDFFKKLGLQMLDLADWGNKAALVLRVLWNVFQNGISVLWNFGQTLAEVQKLQIEFYKSLWKGLTGDFKGAIDSAKGNFKEFKENVKQNLDDIVEAVTTNEKDITTAIEQGSRIQLEIEKAKAEAIKKMNKDVSDKKTQDKKDEIKEIFELDKQLENELIALRAEAQILKSEAEGASFQQKLENLEIQKQAELQILTSQHNEELRKAEQNKLKQKQLEEKFAKQKAIIESKHTKVVQAEEKSRVSANLQGAAIIGSSLEQLFGKNKALSTANSLISTYEAANKALAQGGILGPVAAAAVTAVGLKNVAKIQGLNRGGVVGGAGTRDVNTPTFLTAGEGVLTKDATNRIGSGGISQINDRNGQTQSITNNVTFAPVINASNNDSFEDLLNENFVQFAEFFNEQKEKGLV